VDERGTNTASSTDSTDQLSNSGGLFLRDI